jgi:tRNA (guanosine-2'-O-)-methyltransferase
MDITDNRDRKFKEVISKRQLDLTVVLENVHDPHNIGAVIRSCDAIGVSEIYVLYTEGNVTEEEFRIGKSSSTGVGKWIDIHFYTDHQKCFQILKDKYTNILATDWHDEAQSIYEIDLSISTALVFGNEHDGVSTETLNQSNGIIVIPQMGMAQSLNISVACAVCLFEAMRQRLKSGKYNSEFSPENSSHKLQYENFLKAHHEPRMNKMKTRKLQKLSIENQQENP